MLATRVGLTPTFLVRLRFFSTKSLAGDACADSDSQLLFSKSITEHKNAYLVGFLFLEHEGVHLLAVLHDLRDSCSRAVVWVEAGRVVEVLYNIE